MPVISQLGIVKGKPCAVTITVSDELYKKYKTMAYLVENPISAKFFKKFLTDSNIPFEENSSSTIIHSEEPFSISIWKDADFIAAEDIKVLLNSSPVTYELFIDTYAKHLKSL